MDDKAQIELEHKIKMNKCNARLDYWPKSAREIYLLDALVKDESSSLSSKSFWSKLLPTQSGHIRLEDGPTTFILEDDMGPV